MNIAVIGRGRVGSGLAERWEWAEHTVTRLGREGGDAVDADTVLVAGPPGRSPPRSALLQETTERAPGRV
jgi:hypothetical protein